MADFEVIVRPVVLPNIRPRARQALPPQDDPEKGFAEIKGNPAKSITISNSWSLNQSWSRPEETQRQVDKARVYQKKKDGTVNKDNFVDIEAANAIWMQDGGGNPDKPTTGEDDPDAVNYKSRRGDSIVTKSKYNPIKATDNIKILERDVMKRKEDGGGGGGGGGGGD